MEIKDQLSWNEFLKQSSGLSTISEVKPFNRLIAHSKNLFIVAGYGAFTKGYMIIITKDFVPSFGLVKSDTVNELNFLIKLIKLYHKKKYNRNSVTFEHGMCACIGGLDRAHIHIMSINKNSSEKSLINSIEKVLYNRKAGIEYIKFGKYKLENVHDINQFMDDAKNNKSSAYEIKGKIFKISDIKNLDIDKWPLITLNHINKGGHYVYFRSEFNEPSFLTTQNFQTQFGRQVVYENELELCDNFKSEINNIIENNQFIEPWRWQNYLFEKNIIETVNKAKKDLKDYKAEFSSEFNEFQFEII